MSKKNDDILKQFDLQQGESTEEQKEHSLREQAQARAKDPLHIHAGTAFDWEDIEAYQRELERLDREGPGLKKQ